MDFSTMSNDDLTAALTEANKQAEALFALATPTIEQVDEAEKVLASIQGIEAEQAGREDAANRFAAARASFSNTADEGSEDEADEADEADEDDEDDDTEGEADEADADTDDTESEADVAESEGEAVTTASAVNRRKARRVSAASKVARKAPRPAAPAKSPVTITAAPDVQGFSAGQVLDSMTDVAKAVQNRVRGFAPFNARSAEQVHSQSGGQPVLHKFGAASFGLDFDKSLVASGNADRDYDAMKAAVKQHTERVSANIDRTVQGKALTAAMAWCAPSEVVYNWIADYTVDGLKTVPEISAPRGGLMLTEGPRLAQGTYGGNAGLDAFGFGGTEAQMEAGYTKTCETIECPEFEDHRLDFVGYCWKIPILTEKAYPELVADAMRLSDVLYAHKMNRRLINDIIAESTAQTAGDVYGGSVLDTLEALVQIATKERRWWNLGENAVMEVTLPQYARDIFKFDMARRSGLALNDVATDQKIAAYFANHNLAVEYVSDFDERAGSATPTPNWPETIRAIIYPSGTFVKAVEDVINLSAVYDAASLSANEYTGVFFEQGYMTVKRGYRSTVVTVPVCTAGATGANIFYCAAEPETPVTPPQGG